MRKFIGSCLLWFIETQATMRFSPASSPYIIAMNNRLIAVEKKLNDQEEIRKRSKSNRNAPRKRTR